MNAVLAFVVGAVVGFAAAARHARKRYGRLHRTFGALRKRVDDVDPLASLDALYLMPSAAGIRWEDFDDPD